VIAAAKGCRPNNKESTALWDKLFSQSTSRGDRCPYFSWKGMPEDCPTCIHYNAFLKECHHPEAPIIKENNASMKPSPIASESSKK